MSDFDYKMPKSNFNITRPSAMLAKIDELEKQIQRLREENEDLNNQLIEMRIGARRGEID